MESIIVRSFNRHGGALGNPNDEEKFEVAAELRIYPRTSGGCYNREVGSKLAKCGFTDLPFWKLFHLQDIAHWIEVQEPNGSMYLKKVESKYFRPDATIAEVFAEFKKEEEDYQARFSELMDKAVILDRFIKLNQEGKNE